MTESDLQPLPYNTAAWPGCQGRLRCIPEDFQVREIPLYEPSGAGEHLYLWVEKRNLSTGALVAHLSKMMKVPQSRFGFAGKKDARAVTRQWISVHTPLDPDLASLEIPQLRILQATRHLNKLRKGHLRGNRFRLVIRGIDGKVQVDPILLSIKNEGFPNFFGEQRLGSGLENAILGRSLVRGTLPLKGNLERLRFITNAYQSALFNQISARRLKAAGHIGRMMAGDLAVLHRNGACFLVDEKMLPEIQHRSENHEVSPSAPLFGSAIPLASLQPGEIESAVLDSENLTSESFRLGGKRTTAKGERRAIRAFAHDLSCQEAILDGELSLVLEFWLSKGVYATSLVRELMKNDSLSGWEETAWPKGIRATPSNEKGANGKHTAL